MLLWGALAVWWPARGTADSSEAEIVGIQVDILPGQKKFAAYMLDCILDDGITNSKGKPLALTKRTIVHI